MLPFTRLHGVARLPVYLHSPVYKLVCSERVHRRLDFARLPVYMHLPVYPSTCYARLPLAGGYFLQIGIHIFVLSYPFHLFGAR